MKNIREERKCMRSNHASVVTHQSTRQKRAPLTSRISNAILLLKSVTEPVPSPLSVTTAEEGMKTMEPLTDGAEEEGPKSTAAADRC
uniref:Uncharacterized protein n=1 Tax=Globodera rostochiensis TaxID=31243 RepID=A0A914HS90_GLORO